MFFHIYVYVAKMIQEKEAVNMRGIGGNMSIEELEKRNGREGYN